MSDGSFEFEGLIHRMQMGVITEFDSTMQKEQARREEQRRNEPCPVCEQRMGEHPTATCSRVESLSISQLNRLEDERAARQLAAEEQASVKTEAKVAADVAAALKAKQEAEQKPPDHFPPPPMTSE